MPASGKGKYQHNGRQHSNQQIGPRASLLKPVPALQVLPWEHTRALLRIVICFTLPPRYYIQISGALKPYQGSRIILAEPSPARLLLKPA